MWWPDATLCVEHFAWSVPVITATRRSIVANRSPHRHSTCVFSLLVDWVIKNWGFKNGHVDGGGFGSNMKFGVSLKIFLTASNVDVSRSETQSIGMVASWGPSKIAR